MRQRPRSSTARWRSSTPRTSPASSCCASRAAGARRSSPTGAAASPTAKSSAACARSRPTARVVALFDDLLLGSNVLGMLRAAGHEAQLTGADAVDPAGARVLIVDLAASTFDGVDVVEALRADGRMEGV